MFDLITNAVVYGILTIAMWIMGDPRL